jgi:hypothetical protein
MGYSIHIDWSEELKDCDKWENKGRQAIEEACIHKTQDTNNYSNPKDRSTNVVYGGWCEECNICEDSAQPMMNYAYPLEFEPDEDKIIEVVQKTNCTVMENTQTGEFFLVLCGGGMDLSQDIALAYVICEKWLPVDLLQSVCTQKGLSQDGEDFKRIADVIIEQAKMEGSRLTETSKTWKAIKWKIQKGKSNNLKKELICLKAMFST